MSTAFTQPRVRVATADHSFAADAPRRLIATRNANLDWLRVLAILDIVAFHVNIGAPRLSFGVGLPIFLLITCALAARSDDQSFFVSFLSVRVRRLLLPWLFWSAVYGVHLAWSQVHRGRPIGEAFEANMLLYGAYPHLWFLPFAFGAGIMVYALRRALRHWDRNFVATAGMLLGLLLVLVEQDRTVRLIGPFEQWLTSMPAILLGLAIGVLMSGARSRPGRAVTAATALACMAVGVAVADYGTTAPLCRYAFATGLVIMAIGWPVRSTRLAQWSVSLVYGIYLIHPLLIWHLSGITNLEPPWAFTALVLVLSATLVYAIRNTRMRLFV